MSRFYAQSGTDLKTQKSGTQKITYFPDRGCVHTLLPLYVYATEQVYWKLGSHSLSPQNSRTSSRPVFHRYFQRLTRTLVNSYIVIFANRTVAVKTKATLPVVSSAA